MLAGQRKSIDTYARKVKTWKICLWDDAAAAPEDFRLYPEFEKVAYELEISTVASPKVGECKTSEGYHLIMVEGRK